MTEPHEQIKSLRLFNDKAKKLQGLSFVQALSDTKVTVSGKRQHDETFEIRCERRGPSREAIDAFVLTFRFFIQDNESSSFRNMAAIYDNASIHEELREQFRMARHSINQYLDAPNDLNIVVNDARPSHREILEVFVYGGLAHANPAKHQRFEEWMSFPMSAALLEACFVQILGNLMEAIVFVACLNDDAISHIEASMLTEGDP